jgi:hypothetical protein
MYGVSARHFKHSHDSHTFVLPTAYSIGAFPFAIFEDCMACRGDMGGNGGTGSFDDNDASLLRSFPLQRVSTNPSMDQAVLPLRLLQLPTDPLLQTPTCRRSFLIRRSYGI